MHNTAISIARISVSGAALCLALLVFSSGSSGTPPIPLGELVRTAVATAGVILTASTALLLDWALDNLSEKEWHTLLQTDEGIAGKEIDLKRWDQFIARLRVFGGGYVLLAVGLGGIAGAITWLGNPSMDSPQETFLMSAATISAIAFVFLKMMTKKLLSALLPLIVVALFVLAVFVGPLVASHFGFT